MIRTTAALALTGLLSVSPGAAQEGAAPSGLAGTWQGTLTVPGGSLRVVFNLEKDEGYTATMDSPDQGATGIPTAGVTVDGDSIRIDVPAVGGRYAGVVDGDTIRGTWTQSGRSFPLDLARGEAVEPPARPQEPEPPYPYAARDVTFENRGAGIDLAGTLTLPSAAGPHPGVVLVSGSGPQDRNETLMGHRPFLVLADHLTRRGIAVLRYDDRGVGGSGGDPSEATTEDLAGDARAAVAWLAARPEIDAVGIAGHSEGGFIGPMVARETDEVDFLVLLAAPGLPGEEILRAQGELIARASGADEGTIRFQRTLQETTFGIIRSDADSAEAAARLRSALDSLLAGLPPAEAARLEASLGDLDAFVGSQARIAGSAWFRSFLDLDPRPILREVDVPVLALGGSKDLQVPARENLDAIEEALEAGGNEDVTVREMEGLNHLFQHAGTGSPAEYGTIEETFAPEAMEAISRWILERSGGGSG